MSSSIDWINPIKKETKGILEKGMKIIKLTPEDAKVFLSKAQEEGWREVLKADPQRGQKLRDILSK